MSKKPNTSETREVKVRLPAVTYDELVRLANEHGYGSNPTEVARYLILREVDDLKRTGVLQNRERS